MLTKHPEIQSQWFPSLSATPASVDAQATVVANALLDLAAKADDIGAVKAAIPEIAANHKARGVGQSQMTTALDVLVETAGDKLSGTQAAAWNKLNSIIVNLVGAEQD